MIRSVYSFPLIHGYISYTAHRESGDGILRSASAGYWSVMADLWPGSQSAESANAHAMAQPGQSPSQAQQGWNTSLPSNGVRDERRARERGTCSSR
jgi:hypothetical protein